MIPATGSAFFKSQVTRAGSRVVPARGGILQKKETCSLHITFVGCLSFKHTFLLFRFVRFHIGDVLATFHVQ
jgi:hypothetical protein